ncbi:MAG: Hsp20 family protein [Pseudohongiella sp.]|nr:Hsp20 family protein [Pseudohongiella sp.]
MHNSDLNPSQPKKEKLLVGLLVLSVGAVIALGLYTFQLNKKIDSLTPQTTGPALQALLDSAQPSKQAPHTLSNPAITAIDPSQQIEAIRQQMDAMMSSVFGGPVPSVTGIPGLSLQQPNISLRETDSALEVVIAVPEGQAFELGTDVQEDRLTVTGTISWSANDSNNGLASRRSGSSQFTRTIMLPGTVVPAGMVTEHREGEIVISLPKA